MVQVLDKPGAQGMLDAPSKGSKSGRDWIYNGPTDFALIHGFAGLITVPLVVAAYNASDSWNPVLLAYGLSLGMPHLMATHVRLNLDPDCRQRLGWLAHRALLGIIAAFLLAVVVFPAALPYLVFGWFAAQTCHANAQNFGVMRRYVRMAGIYKDGLVDKTAEFIIQVAPWTFVTTCLLSPATRYLGYDIVLPSGDMVFPLCVGLWAVTVPAILLYAALEVRAMFRDETVPGRVLCVVSGLLVNGFAWLFVREVHWGYLIVSTWHALQYIAYVHSFRMSPPPGVEPMRLDALRHIAILLAAGALVMGVMIQAREWIPVLGIAMHLGLNFHHYLSDMLIWRKPASLKQASAV